MTGHSGLDATSRPVPDISRIAAKYDRVALVLQGGGALGAYQGGVYQALTEARCDVRWIAGVSIGAINSALIAGNPPELRLTALQAFWGRVSNRPALPFLPEGDYFHDLSNQASAFMAMALGQPGFFEPRAINPWIAPAGVSGSTSFYDTQALRQTLIELVDFDRINSGETRLSVGAVNVRTGNFIYFDSAKMKLGPEHVMASGALPPAFPAVEIDGEFYWDGGLVSNTPLQHLLDSDPQEDSLVFQVDLFSAKGPIPQRMSDVFVRQKDITFSSRTRQNTDIWARVHNLQMKFLEALTRIPEDQRTDDDRKRIEDYSRSGDINIVHLIYQKKAYEGNAQDYEFSAASMKEHWASGYADTLRTLRHPEWLARSSIKGGIVIHDLHRDDPT